jgi:hypothetical protein
VCLPAIAAEPSAATAATTAAAEAATAAATASASAEAAAAAAATTTAATSALIGLRLVATDLAAVEGCAVHCLKRGATLLVLFKGHETETAAATRLAVLDHDGVSHLAVLLKGCAKTITVSGPSEPAHEQLHSNSPMSPASTAGLENEHRAIMVRGRAGLHKAKTRRKD